MKPTVIKRIMKWLTVPAAVILLVVFTCLVVLNFPGLFMPESKMYRAITVYTEFPIEQQVDSIMAEVFMRLDAVPIFDYSRTMNLVLCSTQDKFGFFSRFTLRRKRTMGFCLFGNAFVNMDFINELAQLTGGKPKYNAREGSIVHVAVHELMHQYLGDTLGEIRSRSLPTWKIEGYIEYAANHFVASQDSGYSVPERIDVYLDDYQWNNTAAVMRDHYIWGLMMEYMINIKGMSLEEVMAESTTRAQIYQEMIAWYR